MSWINVKDRLPDKGLRILFVCNDLKKVLMGHHIGNGLMQIHPSINGIAAIDNTVFIDMSHWMLLPEPPNE